jgi:hypothetical protein
MPLSIVVTCPAGRPKGSGLDQKLADCQACHGEGSVPSDYRTVAQMMRDHQNQMADIYEKFDHELSEAWRG